MGESSKDLLVSPKQKRLEKNSGFPENVCQAGYCLIPSSTATSSVSKARGSEAHSNLHPFSEARGLTHLGTPQPAMGSVLGTAKGWAYPQHRFSLA